MTEMTESDKLHENHRSRLRKRYREDGLDSFEEHGVLELLLFNVIPRRDTNPIAHRLINKFGSLWGVLHATEEELITVEGIGKAGAEYLAMIARIAKRSELQDISSYPFTEPERVGAYLVRLFDGAPAHTAFILFLDKKMKLCETVKVNSGEKLLPESVIGEILERISDIHNIPEKNYPNIILAHSHSDGRMKPSPEDVLITSRLYERSKSMGVKVCGHYIVSHYDYTDFLSECLSKEDDENDC